MTELIRYALIDTKLKREFVLLQGKGCTWKKCTFCDYYLDISENAYEINRETLEKVTGKYGILDVINSGSCIEIDKETIALINKVAINKNIHTLWFEAHYRYKDHLSDFAKQFPGKTVKFRCGVESFNKRQQKEWNKGIPEDVEPKEIAKYFQGVCLLICTQGQSKQTIIDDIEIAKKYFEYFSVNLFCNNSTNVKRDEILAKWFEKEVYPSIKDDDRIEVLLNNTDLGVG